MKTFALALALVAAMLAAGVLLGSQLAYFAGPLTTLFSGR